MTTFIQKLSIHRPRPTVRSLFHIAGQLIGLSRSQAAILFVSIFIAGAAPVALMWIAALIIMEVLRASSGGSGSFADLAALVVFLMGALVMSRSGTIASAWISTRMEVRRVARLRLRATEGLVDSPNLQVLESPSTETALGKFQNAERAGGLNDGSQSFANVATALVASIASTVVFAVFNVWLAIWLLLAWLLVLWIQWGAAGNQSTFIGAASKGPMMRRAQYLRDVAINRDYAKEIRLYRLQGWALDAYTSAWMSVMQSLWNRRRKGSFPAFFSVVLLVAAYSASFTAIGAALVENRINVGLVLIFAQTALGVSAVGGMSDALIKLRHCGEAIDAIDDLDDLGGGGTTLASEGVPKGARDVQVSEGLAVSDVTFKYPGAERPVLDNLSLEISQGQKIALVGANGSGKSTLVKLLCGLYEPDSGTVRVGGGTAKRAVQSGLMTGALQTFSRLPLTLERNVDWNLGSGLDENRVLTALQAVGLADAVAKLPRKAQTLLDTDLEDGVNLSEGQWQRVAIARALIGIQQGASLVILDEPTSSLDAEAEIRAFELLNTLPHYVTSILVSHRLSGVRHAERIVLLDNGRILEDGSHEELIALNGRYAEMYELQRSHYLHEVSEVSK